MRCVSTSHLILTLSYEKKEQFPLLQGKVGSNCFGFDELNPYGLIKFFYSNLVDKKMKKNNLKGIIWEVTFS